MTSAAPLVLTFEDPRATDVASVGGKNASLAELTQTLVPLGVAVPPGFAVTAEAYRRFVASSSLRGPIMAALEELRCGRSTLQATGLAIRSRFLGAAIPDDIRTAITSSYRALAERCGQTDLRVAVRSSATAEDLPEASFAGQQESFLNVRGEDDVVAAWRRCVASLFTDRAIAYRDEHHFDHLQVALSVSVQQLVRSDRGSAGVIFTIDPETGFRDVVLITGSYGLGENVVKGVVNPDEIVLYKPALADHEKRPILQTRIGEKAWTMVLHDDPQAPTRTVETPPDRRRRLCLSDDDALVLGRWAVQIEAQVSSRRGHHTPMDIEWAKDGESGALFIVQARPETVQSRATSTMVTYVLEPSPEPPQVLCTGRSVGAAMASAKACVIASTAELARFVPGSILVAQNTDPDWMPAMRIAAGVVTAQGGRTCHAAIVSRELGIPAIVGAEGATTAIHDGDVITMDGASGEEGVVYAGALPFSRIESEPASLPTTSTKVMINLADPARALAHWRLPTDGVGLARIEFIITERIGVHPMALVHPERVTDEATRKAIADRIAGYADGSAFFVERLAQGIGLIAASQAPRPVVVRTSDFKSNEYRGLLGGSDFELDEENPMIGFRGASRYHHPRYQEAFRLECAAIKRVRETFGLDNVIVMIPFCRTVDEADRVLATMKAAGLERGEHGLKVYMMCEIPANVILAEDFAARFDGFSIGSNDLTQLTLGVDRDSALLASTFSEENPAVLRLIHDVIGRAHAAGITVGLCGQGPSDSPDFAAFLVREGIDSISLNPDTFHQTRARIAQVEAELRRRPS